MISISKLTNFDITLQLIILSLFSEGLGNYLFGITLFTNVSTLIVYLILIHQLYTRTIFISKKLMFLLLVHEMMTSSNHKNREEDLASICCVFKGK